MYLPEHFREERTDVLHGLMRTYPLATLITYGPRGLEANNVPLLLHPPTLVLRGHLARANQQWQNLTPGAESMATTPRAGASTSLKEIGRAHV